jgi:AAA+ superfamily predicted ATPase
MQVAECVTVNEILPQPRFEGAWESIITKPEIKERLLNSALLALQIRPKLSFQVTALHGLILLYGPPGTGKTTLGRGLAQELGTLVKGRHVRLLEINPHGLMSAEHGQSQQKVFELLCEHLPLLADDGMPTVVLLDEVESMTVSRSAASLAANPADVHRATDAVLAALDRNATTHPHLVTVATSNFTEALDEAFKSRADTPIEVPLPDATGLAAIFRRTLNDFSVAYPKLKTLSMETGIARVAQLAEGIDGRQARKLITDAMTRRRETAADPGRLTLDDLEQAAAALVGRPVAKPHAAA